MNEYLLVVLTTVVIVLIVAPILLAFAKKLVKFYFAMKLQHTSTIFTAVGKAIEDRAKDIDKLVDVLKSQKGGQ